MKVLTWLAVFVLYCAVAAFLCAAAIVNPNLSDTDQYVWCAVAVGWGPVAVLLFYIIFG